MLYSQLTEKDKNLIEYYITHYSNESNGTRAVTLKAPLENILREWNSSKENLYRAFGNNFIVSRNIEIEHCDDSFFARFRANPIYEKFLHKLSFKLAEKFNTEVYNFDLVDGLRDSTVYNMISRLIDPYDSESFSKNKVRENAYRGHTLKIKSNVTGKTYTFVEGEKLMKAIKRIVDMVEDEWCTEHFEEFRIHHSLVLNEKKFKGELCLSIHPLDFMTMSHNDSGWRSCMYWDNDGCYKAGTVEMMNSPNVVVAYLKSSKDMEIGDGNYWNNKKWRCLFIVEDDIIFSVKSYPYQNESLYDTAGRTIAETINNAMGKEIYNFQTIDYKDYDFYYEDECYIPTATRIVTRFEADKMYNDIVEWDGSHWSITNDGLLPKVENKDKPCVEIDYSGTSTCVLCGCYNYNDDEHNLFCDGCLDDYKRCDYCHMLMEIDAPTHALPDGEAICDKCREEHFFNDPLNNDLIHRGSAYRVSVGRQTDENTFERIGDIMMGWETHSRLLRNNNRTELWYTYFNKPAMVMEYPYYHDYLILEEDFNELGRKTFPIEYYERVERIPLNYLNVEREELN